MARFVKGDVVVVPFPFTDQDFKSGSLNQPSNVRPNRIFTADRHIVLCRVGSLRPNKLHEIIEKLVEMIRG